MKRIILTAGIALFLSAISPTTMAATLQCGMYIDGSNGTDFKLESDLDCSSYSTGIAIQTTSISIDFNGYRIIGPSSNSLGYKDSLGILIFSPYVVSAHFFDTSAENAGGITGFERGIQAHVPLNSYGYGNVWVQDLDLVDQVWAIDFEGDLYRPEIRNTHIETAAIDAPMTGIRISVEDANSQDIELGLVLGNEIFGGGIQVIGGVSNSSVDIRQNVIHGWSEGYSWLRNTKLFAGNLRFSEITGNTLYNARLRLSGGANVNMSFNELLGPAPQYGSTANVTAIVVNNSTERGVLDVVLDNNVIDKKPGVWTYYDAGVLFKSGIYRNVTLSNTVIAIDDDDASECVTVETGVSSPITQTGNRCGLH